MRILLQFINCDRIDSDQFPQHAGSIYRVGRWNACCLLHIDWGNSLESETETKVRNGIRNQQETEVGELDIEITCACSYAAENNNNNNNNNDDDDNNNNNNNFDSNNQDNTYDKDNDDFVELPISFEVTNME